MSTKPMIINAICLPLEACFVPYSICFGQEVKFGREILFHFVEIYSLPSHFMPVGLVGRFFDNYWPQKALVSESVVTQNVRISGNIRNKIPQTKTPTW